MKTGQIKLTPIQKETIGLLYYNVKNATETTDALMEDKQLDRIIRYNYIRLWQIQLNHIKTQMDRSLGCNDRFADQIKNSDTMGLSEVINGYIAMSPEGREAVEQLFQAIKNNEEIKVEVV